MSFRLLVASCTVGLISWVTCPQVQGIEQSALDYLYQGKLQEGEMAVAAALETAANDEERFGLGIIQFGLGLEHLLQSLHQHGFLTQRTFGPVIPEELRQLLPDHPDPQPFSNQVFRKMLETWVADLTRAESTLSKISDQDLKFRIQPQKIKIDPIGGGRPVSAEDLLRFLFMRNGRGPAAADPLQLSPDAGERPPLAVEIQDFELALDRGDVHWLRGYLRLQAAVGELLLSLDCKPVIEIGGHRVFQDVVTPHGWLLLEDRTFPRMFNDEDTLRMLLDLVAVFSESLDVAVVEPDRLATALGHLEGAVENGQKMWTFILAETDDDQEWIPNPQQTGSLRIEVNQAMIDLWRETLQEAERVLKGDKLIPFWRDVIGGRKQAIRGISLRDVCQRPPERLKILLWVQGTEATPYLRDGELTRFADEDFLNRLNRVFGANLFGFAAWFN